MNEKAAKCLVELGKFCQLKHWDQIFSEENLQTIQNTILRASIKVQKSLLSLLKKGCEVDEKFTQLIREDKGLRKAIEQIKGKKFGLLASQLLEM